MPAKGEKQNLDFRHISSREEPPIVKDLLCPKIRSVRFNSFDDEEIVHPESIEDESRSLLRKRKEHKRHDVSDQTTWMQRWAYSFRSPAVSKSKHQSDNSPHRRQPSSALQEYPHYHGLAYTWNHSIESGAEDSAETPPPPPPPPAGSSETLESYQPVEKVENTQGGMFPVWTTGSGGRDRFQAARIFASRGSRSQTEKLSVVVAAIFLQDYENSRPPTFASSNLEEISERQITMYEMRYSLAFHLCRVAATSAFFGTSFLEDFLSDLERGDRHYNHRYTMAVLNVMAIAFFVFDVWVKRTLRGPLSAEPGSNSEDNSADSKKRTYSAMRLQEKHEVRTSRSEHLVLPLLIFCAILGFENLLRLTFAVDEIVLFSSILKPLVLFYVSSQARDALAAVRRIIKIVSNVLFVELFLILMFAAVACRLFKEHDDFRDLYRSWLSLFELSTTVVNPSIWMPTYQESKSAALFFVFFVVTSVFYLHSLVLSVVFQTYIHAAAEIHERNATDKEDAVHLAFTALLQEEQQNQDPNSEDGTEWNLIDTRLIRQTLQIVRPHYGDLKINALVEMVDPLMQGSVDFSTFRTKIRHALNSSVRTTRNASNFAMAIELVAVAVAIVNFIYVILYSSPFDKSWFTSTQIRIGTAITLVAAFEVSVRLNPLHIRGFMPLTRLDATFDGLALVAALISCVGIAMYLAGSPLAADCILMGRAVDMIRAMRFFQIFRDVVRRSSDVIPALAGPLTLVVTTLHVFVYIGMALWGGAVEVGRHDGQINELYDLNNFNSYQEGSVTMFQILVVNDWHAIAEVFLYATRCSSPFIVYTFFITANLIGVSIMLNVMTAFFVESFTTQLHEDKDAPAEATAVMHKERDFSIKTSQRDGRRISSSSNLSRLSKRDRSSSHNEDDDSSFFSSDSEVVEFDVYGREGFDTIMQTIAGAHDQEHFAKDLCHYLEIFEALSSFRDSVGYLLCDQHTLERYGNGRFKTKAEGFLKESKLHAIITDMQSELLSLPPGVSTKERPLVKTFPHRQDAGQKLEISASLLRRHPALSLFVSRIVKAQDDASSSE